MQLRETRSRLCLTRLAPIMLQAMVSSRAEPVLEDISAQEEDDDDVSLAGRRPLAVFSSPLGVRHCQATSMSAHPLPPIFRSSYRSSSRVTTRAGSSPSLQRASTPSSWTLRRRPRCDSAYHSPQLLKTQGCSRHGDGSQLGPTASDPGGRALGGSSVLAELTAAVLAGGGS